MSTENGAGAPETPDPKYFRPVLTCKGQTVMEALAEAAKRFLAHHEAVMAYDLRENAASDCTCGKHGADVQYLSICMCPDCEKFRLVPAHNHALDFASKCVPFGDANFSALLDDALKEVVTLMRQAKPSS